MSAQPPTYDLMILLDPQVEQEARERILAEAQSAIQAQGELLRHGAWGERPLAYPIGHKANAEYHLFQFHASTPALLEQLGRFLRIADEVIRFRVIKLAPGTPEAPKAPSVGPATGRPVRDDRVGREDRPSRSQEPEAAPAHAAA